MNNNALLHDALEHRDLRTVKVEHIDLTIQTVDELGAKLEEVDVRSFNGDIDI